jgi:hypothetical protein
MSKSKKKTYVELTTLKSYKDILKKIDDYFKKYGRSGD